MKTGQIIAAKSPISSRIGRSLPPLVAALVCTGLILEAIFTVLRSRANGDLMLMFVPMLGATFLSIPGVQAWIAFVNMIRGK
jgi:hypothetical protein